MSAKTAFVTGGASGIGRAVVAMLAARGHKVCIADKNYEGAKSIAKYLESENKTAMAVEIDVASWDSQLEAFEKAVKEFDRIDYVYAIAGIGERTFIPNDSNAEGFSKPDLTTLDVDLNGLLYTASLAIQQMRRQSKDEEGFRGKIAVTASVCGFYCAPSVPIYTAAKHGVVGFVRSFGKYLANEGITLNATCPNVVKTNISTSAFYDMMDARGLITPMKGVIDAFEDFLDTDISGECLEIGPNGGFQRRAPAEHLDKESGIVMEEIAKRSSALYEPKQ